MKRYYLMLITCSLSLMMLATMAYYYSYIKFIDNTEKKIEAKQDNIDDKNSTEDNDKSILNKSEEVESDTSNPNKEVNKKVVQANTADMVINIDTKYVVINVDISNEIKETSVSTAPSEYIGFTREELLLELNEYMDNLSSDEQYAGLQSIELLSFSSEEVRIQKRYNKDTVRYSYYVVAKNNIIMVYETDMVTLHENTKIDITRLPEEEKASLIEGFFVLDNEQLISILEGYSS